MRLDDPAAPGTADSSAQLTIAGTATVISAQAVAAVEPLIRPYLRTTPVITIDRSELDLPRGPLTLKLEQLQHSGSFKARGAFANLVLRAIPAAGVCAASGGNHGAAVAYAARARRVPARIFVPEVSSPAKVDRIRRYGAELIIEGGTYSDALAACQRWQQGAGALPIHAYDQAETIAGAGTVGLELQRQVPQAATVLAAIGGGGLLSGISVAYAGRARMVGVEPDGAPTMTLALQAGHPVDAPTGSVAVDSLAPRRAGALTFRILSRALHSIMIVTDGEILRAQQLLWDRFRVVAEPGGCTALAALLAGRYTPAPDEHVAVVISGANTAAAGISAPEPE